MDVYHGYFSEFLVYSEMTSNKALLSFRIIRVKLLPSIVLRSCAMVYPESEKSLKDINSAAVMDLNTLLEFSDLKCSGTV